MSMTDTTLTGDCMFWSASGMTTLRLATTVVRILKASLPKPFTVAQDSIVATLADLSTATALGLIFRINLGQEMSPAILTGMRFEGGLVLPPGCRAGRLVNYVGAVSDLQGSNEIVLSIAFDAKAHREIVYLEFTGYPNLQMA